MDYVGRIIRPPSEAGSLLLQVTTGCSHGKCAFCGAYQDKRFAFKSLDQIKADLEEAARDLDGPGPGRIRRVFLCDGDALVMPADRLDLILDMIRGHLPAVTRVAAYANAKALSLRTDEELIRLRGLGLGMVYMGLESGHAGVLERMNKFGDPDFHVRQGRRAMDAGLKLNVTVLLGLGGVESSLDHARATGAALTAMGPHQAAALTLMLIPGTPLFEDHRAGRFHLPDARGMLLELREMLAATNMARGLFLCDHASNHLPLKLRLPRDKASALDRIDKALAGHLDLTPEHLRRL